MVIRYRSPFYLYFHPTKVILTHQTLTYTGLMWMRCSNLHGLWPKFCAQGYLILDMFLLSLCILCNPSGSHFFDAQISRVLIKGTVLNWDLRKNIQVEITCKVGSEVMSGLTLTCWVPGAWRAFGKIILIDIYGFPTSFASPLGPSLANMSRICMFWFQTVNMNSFQCYLICIADALKCTSQGVAVF